jgi:NADPH:quinone reductase-like Zn-dependent oxidoreductase
VRVPVRPVHPGDLMGVVGDGYPVVLEAPRYPGLEGMGVVEALGSGVTGPPTGTRVTFFPAPGALAEYVTASARSVAPCPARSPTQPRRCCCSTR